MKSVLSARLALAAVLSLFAAHAMAAPEPTATAGKPAGGAPDAVVVVGGRSILLPEFEAEVRAAMRQKYYHGAVPEAQILALQRDVANRMIDETLLVEEAKRRGLTPRAEKLDQAVADFDRRYGDSPNWQQNRDKMLGQIRPELERRDLLEQIEQKVRDLPMPSDAEVKAYYEAKKELFTEPERTRISLILLKVDPSSPRLAWDKAMEEAQAIYKRLKAGADFAELARLHSGDESASRGGDMGYLHRGMLQEALQSKVDDFKVSEVQEPIMTLHGPAIIRVDDRVPAKLRSYEDVKARATELCRREHSDTAWKNLLASLRSRSDIRVREEMFGEISARLR
jgi:parvulin-like peptidyl-prolyl isomerase